MSSTWCFSSAICSRLIGQAQFRLGLGQGDPEPPPGAELPLRAPELAHCGRGVTADKRVVVLVEGCIGRSMLEVSRDAYMFVTSSAPSAPMIWSIAAARSALCWLSSA